MKTLHDLNFNNKKALIRVDFNVPLDKDLKLGDATRIEAAKPTIDAVLKAGGSVVLMSHLGRPKGIDKQFSLQHIVASASEILGVSVKFVPDCIGDDVAKEVANLKAGEVLLLENLRFTQKKKQEIKSLQKISTMGRYLHQRCLWYSTQSTCFYYCCSTVFYRKELWLAFSKRIRKYWQSIERQQKTCNSYFRWGKGLFKNRRDRKYFG